MNSTFEMVDHTRPLAAKIFVTQISCCDFHWHHDCEILLVLKGSVMVYGGAKSRLLSAKDMYLFNSREIHGVQGTGMDNLCLCMQFSPDMLDCNAEYDGFYHYFYLDSTDQTYEPERGYRYFIHKLACIAYSKLGETQSSELRLYSCMLDFIADLVDYVPYDLRRLSRGRAEELDGEACNRILCFVEEHLQEEHLQQELCSYMNMSEKSLYRYLKTTLGLTIKELIDVTRVEKARAMLRETTKPLAIIWQTCGYYSEVSFYRNFRKHMGVTPNEYRKGRAGQKEPVDEGSYLDFDLDEANRLLYQCLKDTELEWKA